MAGSITKPKKPKSKRTPVRLRHKIEKKSAEKQRKARKEAKKNPQWKSKLKKDPGIPNLFPYKEKILHEIEEARRKKEEEIQKRREIAKAAKTVGAAREDDVEVPMAGADGEDFEGFAEDDDMMDEDEAGDDSNPMAALIASAKKAAERYDRELESGSEMDDEEDSSDSSDEDGGAELSSQTSSRKAYDKVFKKVIEQADVVLYVLDARDPEGTRSREVERMIMATASGGKRLVLILNKIDLVPTPVLKGWLTYLRRYFPTLPLRASGSAPNAHTFNHRDLTVQSTSATLFKSLKSFAASKQLKRAVSVGVIGYPNVGKSSVINALLSRLGGKGAACPAGAEAGVTTSIRSVKIDSKLTLLDSPGIVFPSTKDGEAPKKKNPIEAHASLVLLNAVPPKEIDDPLPAVGLLLKRLSTSPDLLQKLMDVYDLPPLMTAADGDATTDFLVQVARKRGRLSRGGVPNITSAAMTVITDWRDGRIQGWVDAPVLPVSVDAKVGDSADTVAMPDQKEIVTEWAKEFKLDGLWGEEAETADLDAMEP
ncbi:P-loop containing nucleoside triphosphate hydrolase protein [Xylariales sp. AK1849]|nr:P-loop containing nucleoside triphosphate hydrolase protein [Xylariales sp. AK1849]